MVSNENSSQKIDIDFLLLIYHFTYIHKIKEKFRLQCVIFEHKAIHFYIYYKIFILIELFMISI